jgi:hypothetical protein
MVRATSNKRAKQRTVKWREAGGAPAHDTSQPAQSVLGESPNERFDVVVLKEGKFHRVLERFMTPERAHRMADEYNGLVEGGPTRAVAVRIENLPPFVWRGE